MTDLVRRFWLLPILCLGVAASPALAGTIISYDGAPASLNYGGNPVGPGELLDLTTGLLPVTYPFDAASEDINAAHLLSDGTYLLSTETVANIGGTSYQADDLIRYDPVGGTATNYKNVGSNFSAIEDIDAVYLFESGLNAGKLLLSTSGAATIGGQSFDPGDIFLYDPDANVADAVPFFDDVLITGTTLFGRDTNAVHVLPNGNLLLSAPLGTLGGISMAVQDIIEWDGATASVWLDGDGLFDGPTTDDIDALTLTQTPEPAAFLLMALGGLGLLLRRSSR